MGPLCEEHVPKNDASVWSCKSFEHLSFDNYHSLFSALVPVHTRVLFDILQEAYRVKARGRSGLRSHNDQVNFPGLLTTNNASSSLSHTTAIKTKTTKKAKSYPITRKSETSETEHVIQADGIQLENIFPRISTLSTSDMYTQSFTTQQDDYNNETNLSTNITSNSMIQTTENISTTLLSLTTVANMMTVSVEQNQTNDSNIIEDQESFHTTEQYDSIITSVPSEWSSYNSDNQTFDDTTELMQNSTAQISNNTEFDNFFENTTSQTINETSFESIDDSSNQTDNNPLNTSEPTMTSILTSINSTLMANKSIDSLDISKSAHHQLLLKLCQQLLSQILPNVTSLSTSAAIEAALSLSSSLPASGNNSAEALLIWIEEQLSSTPPTPLPPPTTTTTTAPPPPKTTTRKKPTVSTTRVISSSLPTLLINEKKISSISLQRVDMDDILHQMNNNVDGEN